MKLARILLGLFICWQLFFLLSFNLLSLLQRVREFWQDKPSAEAVAPEWLHEKGRVTAAERAVIGVTTRWAEVSGQPQNWSLFAPNVTSIIPFVAVEFSWDEEPGSRDDRSEIQKLERRLTDLLKTGDVQAPPPAPWRTITDHR